MSNSSEEVVYRTPTEADIDEIGSLVSSVWPMSKNGEARLEAGVLDYAHMTIRTTFALVAEFNGHVIGYIAARAGSPEPEIEKHWSNLYDETFKKIEEASKDVASDLAGFYEFEERAHKQMLKDLSDDTTFELVLFAVSQEARGRGVGSTLLGRAVDYLKSQGASSMFLYTDSTCNWQYYENRGMERAATYIANESELAQDWPKALYIYRCNL